MKKVLLITISVLLFLGLISFGLYYFRDPVWDNNYEMSEYDYLDEYLYHYEDDTVLRGTLWVKYSTNGGNNFHLFPINSDLDVKLPLLLKEKFEIDVVELNGEEYPVFLSLDFKQSEKNFIDEILCTYVKGNYCKRDVRLNSWRVYENTYPFPEIEISDGLEMIDENMDYFIESNTDISEYPLTCSDLLAEYVYRKHVLGQNNTEALIKDYSKPECTDLRSQMDYATLLDSYNIVFDEFNTQFCRLLQDVHFDSIPNFFESKELSLINKLCDTSVTESEMEGIAEGRIYSTDWSLSLQSLFLLNNASNYENEIKEIEKLLGSKVFSLQIYPGCLNQVTYKPELLYLTRILLDE